MTNKWIVDQRITEAHSLKHSPSVGGNEAELEAVFEALDGFPITGSSYHFPSLASHGHAIGSDVLDGSIPTYLTVSGMIVVEGLAPAPHAVVPPVAPIVAASVVYVQLVFVPSLSLSQVAWLIAAPEV